MDSEHRPDLLIPAIELYRRVVADPMAHGTATTALVARARAALRAGGPAEPLVAALRAEAWFEHARLADGRAKALLDEAARLAQRHALGERLAEVLVTRAAVNLELGRPGAARRDLDRALGTTGGEPPAEVGLAQASLFYSTGRLDAAAVLCRRVLADPSAPAELRAKVANNLAMIEVQHGRPAEALALLDEADALAADLGEGLAAVFTCTRAWVLAQAGRLAESLRWFDDAEGRYRKAGLPPGELFLEHLDALADLRLLPEARALAERAVAEFDDAGVALMGDDARLRLAQIDLLAGSAAAARQAGHAAARAYRRRRRPGPRARADTVAAAAALLAGAASAADLATVRRAARTLQRLGMTAAAVDAHLVAGRVALALDRPAVALGHLDEAAARARPGSVLVRLRGRLAAALAADTRDDRAGALRQARAGLADLSRHRAALGSMELRALASTHGVELGRIGLRTLLGTGSPVAVLEWMERIRAAAQLAAAPAPAPEVQVLLDALHAVHAGLERARAEGRGEPAALLSEQAALEAAVRRASWRHRSDHDPGGAPVSVPGARRLLDGAALVAFGRDASRLFAVALTTRRSALVPLGPVAAVRAESDALLFALRRLTRPGPARSLAAARSSAEHAIGVLRAALLAPLGLDDDVPLVVVPDAATRAVPWSALHPGPVAVAPSLSSWARSRAAGPRPRASRTVLVAGPDLPGAVGEVGRIAAVHPRAAVLVAPQATVPAVTAALSGADLAHLACHGLLRADNPTFSALRLAGGDLTLHALDQIGSAPRRVVLAACDSATGVGYDGDEVLGFVASLMARGTTAVAASVAPVGDTEAVELNVALHRALRAGRSMAEAVHAARAGSDPVAPREFVNHCALTAFGAG